MVVDNHRLAYVSEAPVNWCPALGTVLSNEEVTADGRSECTTPCSAAPWQWMRASPPTPTAWSATSTPSTGPSDQADAAQLDRPVRRLVTFLTKGGPASSLHHPARHAFGATYMVLAPEHPLVDELTTDVWPGDACLWSAGAATPREAIAAYRRATSRRSDIERQVESREKTGRVHRRLRGQPPTGTEIPCSSPTTC